MSESSVKHVKVQAKTSYTEEGKTVDVNSNVPLKLSTDEYDIFVIVRIKDFVNDEVDDGDHEKALEYFKDKDHTRDTMSIQFAVTFKEDVVGSELKWGNDWDHPIRDMIPWGFSAAFSTFKYAIDPGVDGDVYADKPWVYGALLSSINRMKKLDDSTKPESVLGPIEEEDASARSKNYLNKENLSSFTFKKGETYVFDFYNPYLDLSSSPKIKMPGFTFDISKYAGMTDLRYVLKREDKLVFALVFTVETSS